MPTPENVPIPDPSTRSTEALEREIMHLRELIDSRLATVDQQFLEQDKAVIAALDAAHKAVVELEQSITRRLEAARDIVEAKYVTYRTLLDSNAEKVQAALIAADKAVAAAFASSKEAISKAETFNEKRFDILTKQIDELKAYQASSMGREAAVPGTAQQLQDLSAQVQALRDYRETARGSNLEARFDQLASQLDSNTKTITTSQGKGVGLQQGWGYLIAGVGLIVVVVNVFIDLIK